MKTVLEYLEISGERFPEKIAAIDPDNQCTYAQLISAAKSIGSALLPKVAPQQSVVCFMDKSVPCLETFFGILYAGGFYTLLDPSFPQERIRQILSILSPAAIITTHEYDEQLSKLGTEECILYLDELPQHIDQDALDQVRKITVDTDPVYCNFTSGSTGVPKGVLVGNRSVIDFIDTFTETFHLSNKDVFGNQAPFDFDVSVKDIYSSIKLGATLVIVPKSYFMSPTVLVEYLEKHHVTTLIWAVSALCMLIRLHALKHLRPSCINKIMFSGEVMPIKQFNQWRSYYPDALFVNLYGPTEITCNCTYYIVDREFAETDKIPMGVAFDNERVFLLNDQDQLVLDDQPGEVCVSGTALALGYYRNPEMTAKSFVQNPLNDAYPERIYRTGDLAQKINGQYFFVGRKDFQIKHMGHRIELEEIESILNSVAGITHACCIYDMEKNKVVAFYCGNVDKVTIIDEMKKAVPEYMIPNLFRQMETLPLTKNGKTDRKLLAQMFKKGE